MPFDIGGYTFNANTAFHTINEAVVQQGLVLHLNAAVNFSYPGTGSTWYDTSIFSHHGTFVDNTTYVTTSNGAMSFDGTGDYINGVHNTTVNITGDMSAEAWFRVAANASDWVRVFGKGNTTTRTYGLWYYPGSQFLYQRAGSIQYFSAPVVNTWYYIAGTSSGNNHTLYLNGVAVNTATWGVSTGVTDPYTVGYAGVHTYHNGLISVVRLYNRALSAEEISVNFNVERARYGV